MQQSVRDVLRVVEIDGCERFVRRHAIEALAYARRDAREPLQRVDQRPEARDEIRAAIDVARRHAAPREIGSGAANCGQFFDRKVPLGPGRPPTNAESLASYEFHW